MHWQLLAGPPTRQKAPLGSHAKHAKAERNLPGVQVPLSSSVPIMRYYPSKHPTPPCRDLPRLLSPSYLHPNLHRRSNRLGHHRSSPSRAMFVLHHHSPSVMMPLQSHPLSRSFLPQEIATISFKPCFQLERPAEPPSALTSGVALAPLVFQEGDPANFVF